MPTRYNRYTIDIKLRDLEAAQTGGTGNVSLRKTMSTLILLDTGSTGIIIVRQRCNLSPVVVNELRRIYDIPARNKLGYHTAQHINHLGARLITIKQFHTDPQYMNMAKSKLKYRGYLIHLQQLKAIGKSAIYMDATNFDL
ncbi:hypothetical protein PHPALM_11669 [Phytophthora palmivora]|uniref:Uncharacterized protein n=1 Tax=Phytophthora palmivora TaxID=4796 RepID=A0A2P4Y1Q0_9STRA|nr:hypothetical protein PHPALM_11669 [Phytophthora palmivora]